MALKQYRIQVIHKYHILNRMGLIENIIIYRINNVIITAKQRHSHKSQTGQENEKGKGGRGGVL